MERLVAPMTCKGGAVRGESRTWRDHATKKSLACQRFLQCFLEESNQYVIIYNPGYARFVDPPRLVLII